MIHETTPRSEEIIWKMQYSKTWSPACSIGAINLKPIDWNLDDLNRNHARPFD